MVQISLRSSSRSRRAERCSLIAWKINRGYTASLIFDRIERAFLDWKLADVELELKGPALPFKRSVILSRLLSFISPVMMLLSYRVFRESSSFLEGAKQPAEAVHVVRVHGLSAGFKGMSWLTPKAFPHLQ